MQQSKATSFAFHELLVKKFGREGRDRDDGMMLGVRGRDYCILFVTDQTRCDPPLIVSLLWQ